MQTTRDQVDAFLQLRRIAVVGVSRDPKQLSHTLWQEFRQRRVEAIPVNPGTQEIDGQRCYAHVSEIQPSVEGALIITPPEQTPQVIEECAAAGIRMVWLHKGIGRSSWTADAEKLARARGLDVVAALCPYMFLPGTPAVHRVHAWGKKVTGSYPG
jgi:predicted CoA-binding protein